MFGDGSTARDYTYIDDIVDGVIAAIDHPLGFEVINLGESQTTTLRELIAMLERLSGKVAQIEEHSLQPGGGEITFADVSKARRLLDYNPSTPIETGLRLFLDWFEDTRL